MGKQLPSHARKLLNKVSNANLSNEAFPFSTGKDIEIGHGTAYSIRMSFVGELGWELYIPTPMAPT